ncbi:hypothetical protein ACFRCX_30350 [Streptomyces sp. NPDC056652]|uniref:hypothetical protein n=1 Tax=Streptomyces sp. NPDC056652 TaxID=3345893 RepID=UPI0036809896
MTHPALDVAAKSLHDFSLARHHAAEGRPPEAGRYPDWHHLSEGCLRSYRWKAQKAFEAETFEGYYEWMTMAERMAGLDVPAPDSDTERVRGHQVEYHIVQHLLTIRDGVLSESQA